MTPGGQGSYPPMRWKSSGLAGLCGDARSWRLGWTAPGSSLVSSRPLRSARYRPAVAPGVSAAGFSLPAQAGQHGAVHRPGRVWAARHATSSAITCRCSQPTRAGERSKETSGSSRSLSRLCAPTNRQSARLTFPVPNPATLARRRDSSVGCSEIRPANSRLQALAMRFSDDAISSLVNSGIPVSNDGEERSVSSSTTRAHRNRNCTPPSKRAQRQHKPIVLASIWTG